MDIRQLIEHAFQKLKFVMLYEMEQLIINTYTHLTLNVQWILEEHISTKWAV